MRLRHNRCLRAVVVTKAERFREGPLRSREVSELGKGRDTPFSFSIADAASLRGEKWATILNSGFFGWAFGSSDAFICSDRR